MPVNTTRHAWRMELVYVMRWLWIIASKKPATLVKPFEQALKHNAYQVRFCTMPQSKFRSIGIAPMRSSNASRVQWRRCKQTKNGEARGAHFAQSEPGLG